MESELPLVSLPDAITLQRGFDLPEYQRRPGSVPVVASTKIVGFHDQAKAPAPGVVMGRSGSIGGAQYLNQDFWPLNTTLWVKDFKGNDPRWVYYLLKGLDFGHLNAGSGVPTLNRNHLIGTHVWVPELDEQRRIAGVLGSLDAKIELNRELARTLEHTVGEFFRARFIYFVGVEHFEKSGIGRLPKGWAVMPLSELADERRETVKGPRDDPYIGLDSMPQGSTVLAEWKTGDAPTGQARLFEAGDILFGKLRPYFRKVGPAPIDGRASTEIVVLRPDPPYWGFFLGHISSERFIDHCTKISTGTRMPRAEWKSAGEYEVAVPPPKALADFNSVAESCYALIRHLVIEMRTLATLRDSLLPKLISGEIRVPDEISLDDAGEIADGLEAAGERATAQITATAT